MSPTLISNRTVKARKRHLCRTCDQDAVQPGETYRRAVYVFDGSVYAWIQCQPCRDCTPFVWEWCGNVEDGINSDDYCEWSRDMSVHATDPAEKQAALEHSRRIHDEGFTGGTA